MISEGLRDTKDACMYEYTIKIWIIYLIYLLLGGEPEVSYPFKVRGHMSPQIF